MNRIEKKKLTAEVPAALESVPAGATEAAAAAKTSLCEGGGGGSGPATLDGVGAPVSPADSWHVPAASYRKGRGNVTGWGSEPGDPRLLAARRCVKAS